MLGNKEFVWAMSHWAMSQKLTFGSFECIKNISQFNEDFMMKITKR